MSRRAALAFAVLAIVVGCGPEVRQMTHLREEITAMPSLVAYWPLGDPPGPTVTPTVGTTTLTPTVVPSFPPLVSQLGITLGVGDGPPGDDLGTCVQWSWAGQSVSGSLAGRFTPALTVNSTDVLELVAWVNPAALPLPVSLSDLGVIQLYNQAGGDFAKLRIAGGVPADAMPGKFTAEIGSGSWTATVTGPQAPTDRWGILGAKFALANTAGAQQVWSDDVITSGTAGGGAAPASMSFDSILVGLSLQGKLQHVQIYVGPATTGTTFDHGDFIDQRAIGLTGLERQTTGERIRTVATWAGVRGGEMNVDTGTSVMQKARLAGLTALDEMHNAERTEQGLMHMDGSGILQFRDRRATYNV